MNIFFFRRAEAGTTAYTVSHSGHVAGACRADVALMIGPGAICQASDAAFAVFFSGRLDGRDSLAKSLGVSPTLSPARLAMEAYRHWGRDCPNYMTGEFLWALWDKELQALLCVRDVAGVAPAFFALAEAWFHLCSELGPLVSQRRGKPNYGFLAESLTLLLANQHETPFVDAQRLPPGHWLWVDRSRCLLHRYWRPLDYVTLPQNRQSDFQEEFDSVLRLAINDRRPKVGELGLLLSGGLDSTLLAAAACEPLATDQKLRCYSLTFTGKPWDEGSHVAALENLLPLVVHRIDMGISHWPDWEELSRRSALPPEYPTVVLISRLMEMASREGVTTIMSGDGGDNWFFCDGNSYRDYLKHRRWASAMRLMRRHYATGGCWRVLRHLARDFLWPITPTGIRRSFLDYNLTHEKWPLLNPEFLDSVGLRNRLRVSTDAPYCSYLGLARRVHLAQLGISSWVFETLSRTARFNGLSWTAPLLDRRMVEFALRAPLHVLANPDADRSCHRRTLARLLTSTSWRRNDKSDLRGVYFAALRSPEVAETLLAARHRCWVNAAALTKAVDQMMSSPVDSHIEEWRTLWGLFAVEIWHRVHFDFNTRPTSGGSFAC